MQPEHYLDTELLEKYEFYNYNHALEILTEAFPEEWSNIVKCLRQYRTEKSAKYRRV